MRSQNSQRFLRAEHLEDRRCLAANCGGDGSGVSGASLTDHVNAGGSDPSNTPTISIR